MIFKNDGSGLSHSAKSPLKLLLKYMTFRGTDRILNDDDLQQLFRDMMAAGKIDFSNIGAVPGVWGLYYEGVYTDDISYGNAIGHFNMYFQKTGGNYIPVGMSDYYNFDAQPAGSRSVSGETKTQIGAYIPGTPFHIRGGYTPSPEYISDTWDR